MRTKKFGLAAASTAAVAALLIGGATPVSYTHLDDVGRYHLPALRQRCQKRLREKRIQLLRPREQADKNEPDSEQHPNQAVAQLEEM